ncbi:MAG: glutamine synthetase family protein [Clostridiales bacterium]|nr:glutamine synthetase family protein [Clostridiales bacterium]
MVYTKKEVIQYVNEEDVKFIRLAFCDAFGNQKNVSVMPDELERAFENGICIDASAVTGFGGDIYSDLLLFPDPSTLAVLPWRPSHGRVVRMFCAVTYPDGNPFEMDSRKLLKNAVKTAMEEGYLFSFGSEFEFYLFKTDEEGNPTDIPYDNATYMDIAPADKGENIRREICLTLEQMGIKPESSHHEEGPGQNEINFRFSDPITAADNAVTFMWVVKTVAARNGLYADFSPKPMADKPGNSFHINMSIQKVNEERGLLPYAIAGIMNRITDMTVFLNPTDNSYERLGKCKAPRFITWSQENRSQLIRIPAAGGTGKRLELRSPDPKANPYIAFALIIYAVLEGIRNKELPAPAENINLFSIPENEQKNYAKIPESLKEAKSYAEKSEFIRTYLPDTMIKNYCK